MILNSTAQKRFWIKVQKTEGCWNWTGSKDRDGYGRFGTNGRNSSPHLAQRVSWFIKFGDIPEGSCILHRCDNPSCVNPDHLFIGTPYDNMRDMVEKCRHGGSSKTHCPKGHSYSGSNVYLYKNQRHCRICNLESVRKYALRKLA